MPWCEPCAKYLAPATIEADGTCPDCGTDVAVQSISGRVTAKNLDLKRLAEGDPEAETTPWHFKLLVGLLIIYLGWRIVQLFV